MKNLNAHNKKHIQDDVLNDFSCYTYRNVVQVTLSDTTFMYMQQLKKVIVLLWKLDCFIDH